MSEELVGTHKGTNGSHFIIYTLEEGGLFKVAKGTRAQYDEAVRTGILTLPTWRDDGPERVKFFFIMFTTVEDNFDAGFGCSRDDKAGVARWYATPRLDSTAAIP